MTEREDLRASDADRNLVAQLLTDAMARGQISLAEFEDRSTQAYGAVTYGDLDHLTDDLPAAQARPATIGHPGADAQFAAPHNSSFGQYPAPPGAESYVPGAVGGPVNPPAPGTPGAPLAPGAAGVNPAAGGGYGRPLPGAATVSNQWAIMSGPKVYGVMNVPADLKSFAFWGGGELDLTSAIFPPQPVTIKATAIMGSVDIWLPADATIYTTGNALMGEFNLQRNGPKDPGVGSGYGPTITVCGFAFWGSVSVRRGQKRGWRERLSDWDF